MKLDSCKNASYLTPAEKDVLGQFIELLTEKTTPWLEWEWNLCPICQKYDFNLVPKTP